MEPLEERLAPATYHVDVLNPLFGTGTTGNPFKYLQTALATAAANAGPDDIIVYGNTSSNPQNVYVWTRDGDRDSNGILDGDMFVAANDRLIFRAQTLLQGPAGTPAPVVVKLANNIVDIAGELRVEGQGGNNLVYFTSFQDDSIGGDTNADGTVSAPNRLDWGGIRFRGGAVDQGPGSSSGSLIQWADIRYTGQTLFDPIAQSETEFASIRMESDGVNSAVVRVWDTVFRHGGKALDVHFRSLAGSGPDIGGTGVITQGVRESLHPVSFEDNSINGLFVNIPFVPIVALFNVMSTWDDIGVPYVLTQRLIVTQSLTIEPGMIIKMQREQIDTTTNATARLMVNGTVNQPVIFTSLSDDDAGILAPFYNNGSLDTGNDGATPATPGDWGGIQVNNGNIDHAIIRYGGGSIPFNGRFVNRSPLNILCFDLRPLGPYQDFRLSNTEITQTLSGVPAPGLNFGGMPALQVLGDGLITVIDNWIHDNPGSLGIYAGSTIDDPLGPFNGPVTDASLNYNPNPHPLGGYGVHYRRNILEGNANNGVFANIITGHGYIEDTDIVLTVGSFLSVGGTNQVRQLMSQRTVAPSINTGYLDRFQGTGLGNAQFATFVNQIQAQGALLGPNPTNLDNTLFYYLVNFLVTPRGLTIPGVTPTDPGNLRGEEWRDWGVDFRSLAGTGLFPLKALAGSAVSDNALTTADATDNSSMEIVFSNFVNAVGFWIVNNASTSGAEVIEFYGDQNQLLETIALPTTGAGPVFIGRVSKQAIYRIVIKENANDGDTMGIDDLYFVNAGESLAIKMADLAEITTGTGVNVYDGVDVNPVSGAMVLGPTLRILGQANNPVQITHVADDSIGAGIFGHFQTDTNGDGGASTSAPGAWDGISILPGVNASKIEFVTQLGNGTIVRTSSDKNPYTIGDEAGSIPDTLTRLISGVIPATQNLQDGTLIEHADIRFANIGIDNQGYPDGKLALEGNEEDLGPTGPDNDRAPDSTTAGAFNTLQPISQTFNGAVRLGGSIFLNNRNSWDIDVFRLTNQIVDFNAPHGFEDAPPASTIYVDVDHTRNDTATLGQYNVYGFNFQGQLVYLNSRDFGGTANYLGGILEIAGNVTADFQNDPLANWDAEYIVITPRHILPRVIVPDVVGGRLTQGTVVNLLPLGGANEGFRVLFTDTMGMPLDTPQFSDYMANPFVSDLTLAGVGQQINPPVGYEVEFREPNGPPAAPDRHQGRLNDAIRNLDGEIIFRQNLIRDFGTAGIYLHDYRIDMTGTPLAPTVFGMYMTASGRYFYPNNDREPTLVQFTNPNIYIPGIQVYNNVIRDGAGHGVQVTEDTLFPQPNLPTPTGYHQILSNTIHNNSGNGVDLITRGGPNILNNIFTKNNFGVRVTDLGFPAANTVVNYNLFFDNAQSVVGTVNPAFPGNNIVNKDPRYVDATNRDLRVLGSVSPAVDAAISNLSDRLFAARNLDEPTRSPNDDFRDRLRIDNPTRSNVGTGQFPFYDVGAYEANESPLRIIALKPFFAAGGIVPGPVAGFSIDFAGRVDPSTVVIADNPLTATDERTVKVLLGLVVRQITTQTNVYDPVHDIHTFTFTFDQPLADGFYCVYVDGTSTAASPGAVRDIAGQLLDGEFPPPATAPVFSFPSGNNVPGGDFNYCFTVVTSSIGDLVWNDVNGDGIRQLGEAGIPNVQLNLVGAGADSTFGTGDDLSFPTQLTNSSGNYLFALLAPGLYRVSVVQSSLPANFALTNPPEPRDILLSIDEDRLDVDFGYWLDLRNAVIGDLVWDDLNGDGNRQPIEPGIPGVRIDLVGSGPDRVLGTADDISFPPQFTDGLGLYRFLDLPAWSYRVTVDTSSPALTGYALTTGNQPLTVSLTPGQIVDTADFGYQQANARITGLVWEDLNQNGGFNSPPEFGFNAARVFIDANNNNAYDVGERFTTTDGQGNWDIGGLTSGTYKVMVDVSTLPPPLPWIATTVHPRSVTLDPGETETGVNFGFVQDPSNATLSGRVFNDVDGDRSDDGSGTEAGLNGPTRVFIDANSNNAFDPTETFVFTTNAAGDYAFINLPGGVYRIVVDESTLPAPGGQNWVLTSLNSKPKIINLAPSSTSTGNGFGFQDQRATISGLVWNDNGAGGGIAGDGVLQPGETGRFAGVTVFDDLNNNGALDTAENERVSTITGGAGSFTISNVGVGTHRLRILSGKPPAFAETTPVPLVVLVSTSTQILGGANIGLQEQNGVIQGLVFIDLNGDGFRDPGENAPVTGATVFLDLDANGFDAGDPFVDTTTDGLYSFTGLAPGSYLVGAIAPAGGTVTTTPNPTFVFTDGSSTATQDWGVAGVFGGVFYMTFSTGGSLFNSDASVLLYTTNDIVRLKVNTDGSWQYTTYFKGSTFGLANANERIDAFYIVPAADTPVGYTPGQILISTSGAHTVQTNYNSGVPSGAFISGFGEDVLRFTPTAYNPDGTPRSGTWFRRFDGSLRRLTGVNGNVDGVGLRPDGKLLLSTAGFVSGLAGSVTAFGEDIIQFNFATNSFSRFFDGSQVGLSGASENVNAFYVSSDLVLPNIWLSTAGSFSVPVFPTTGSSSDIVQFTPTSLGAVTSGFFGPGLYLQANLFGHAGKNVTGFNIGLAPFDSPQLTTGAGNISDHDDVVVRWPEAISHLHLFIDATSLTAAQTDAIRRAISTADEAWEQTAGKGLVEVSDANQADVIIRGDHTTAIGGKAQGVLGYTYLQYDMAVHGLLPDGTPYTEFVGRDVAGPGSITFVVDWNWYTGSNPRGIKRGQYDLQTTATHELGHVLGLPDNLGDRRSPMTPRLLGGQVLREFSKGDVKLLDQLYSAATAPVTTTASAATAQWGEAASHLPAESQALDHLFAALTDDSRPLGQRKAAQLVQNLDLIWDLPV